MQTQPNEPGAEGFAWPLNAGNGTLTLRTGVAGPASRMGHRLAIEMDSWHTSVDWDGRRPVSATLVVDVDSLKVLSGEGGLTPLSGPEKSLIRSNALKILNAKRFPTVEFHAESITERVGGYLLHGPLTVRGVSRNVDVELAVSDDGDTLRFDVDTTVSQAAHKVKPYSMAMGAMKVADAVRVVFTARCPKPA